MKILILPMDDRPCTYNFPLQIGNIYGAEIIIPPREKMGNLEKIADRDFLKKWIKEVENLDGIVIASDTLAYGGLIPSRRNFESFEAIIKNLKIIIEVKKQNPDLMIYICSTILRISNSNENQEEKEYWKDYGQLIHQCSSLIDKNNLISDEEYNSENIEKIISNSDDQINQLKKQLPENILKDYIEGRFRNFKINKLLIEWLKEGYIDYLSICADDSSQHGFNVIEKRILNKIADSDEQLKNKLNIYPGADEAITSLVAGLINRKNNFTPKFYPVYSKYSEGKDLITMYEGIPLENTLKNQISVVGGIIAASQEESDIVLYLYTSDKIQEDQYLNAAYNKQTISVKDSIKDEFIDYLTSDLNKDIVFIDLAYANGADHSFIIELLEGIDIKKLSSFSAWNTTGNSIGTALAHSSVRFISKKQNDQVDETKHYQFLFERFFDDWLYQGYSRLNYVRKNGYHLSEHQLLELKELYIKDLNNVISSNEVFKNLEIKEIYFPWNRPFEISVTCN